MKQAAKISITSIQDNNKTVIMLDGTIEILPLTTTIEYTLDGVLSSLSLSEDVISITRHDETTFTMVFSDGKCSPFKLIFPGGELYLTARPKKILKKIEPSKINVYLSYTLTQDDNELLQNKLWFVCNY